MEIKRIVGDNIRFIREKRGQTQDDLAILAKMSKTFVGDIERAQKAATVVSIAKLAKVLRVTPALLLTPYGYKTIE
jgi:transcriptional regulator with XRE-family HTH domain